MDVEDQAHVKPTERNTRRRKPQVVFAADGYAEGWAFLVPRSFYPALDIVLSDRVKTKTNPDDGTKTKHRYQEWTEGDPPLYAFRETDALQSRDVVTGSLNRYIAQITQAKPDTLDGKVILPGSVGFRFFEWQDGDPGAYKELGFHLCTQAVFVEFLKSGLLPPTLPDQSPA